MQIVTVPGGNGVTIAIPFTSESNQLAAEQILQALDYADPQLVHVAYAETGFDNAVSGDINELIDSVPGQVAVPDGYQYLISDYVSATSAPYPANSFIGYGDFNGSSIDATSSQLTFQAGTGAVTIVAGGALNITTLQNGSAGGTLLLDGGYMQTVTLTSGNWSLQTGLGTGSATLGSGQDTVTVNGRETVTAGSGRDTISLDSAESLVYAGAATGILVDQGGSDTIVGGSGWDTIFAGGAALSVTGGSGQIEFVDQSGHNFFAAGSGGGVVFGSAVGSTYQTGGAYFIMINLGGDDTIDAFAGNVPAVIFGSAGCDITLKSDVPNSFVVGEAGSETINASTSSDGVVFFGGSGNSDFIGGQASNFFAVSTGNATLSGGSGNLYEFIDGHAGGTYVISDFHSDDFLYLSGYGTKLDSGIATEFVNNGTLEMNLSDGTLIIFQNLNNANELNGHIHNI